MAVNASAVCTMDSSSHVITTTEENTAEQSERREIYESTVRVCCRRPHTMPQVYAMIDTDPIITASVVGVTRLSQGRVLELEVPEKHIYNQLILQGIFCPTHKVKHKVVPVFTEDKCLITAYNTPIKDMKLQQLETMLEESGYEIVTVHHVEFRPGLKSGIRKYLVKFKPYRSPVRLPSMVDLYGRKIGFEQTPSTKILDRFPVERINPEQEREAPEETSQTEIQRETPETLADNVEDHMDTEGNISTSPATQEFIQSVQEPTQKPLKSDIINSNQVGKSIAAAVESSVYVDGRSFAGVVKAATVPVIKTSHTQPSEILKSMFAPKPSMCADTPSIIAEHTALDSLQELYLRKAKTCKTNDPRTKTNPYPTTSLSSIKNLDSS